MKFPNPAGHLGRSSPPRSVYESMLTVLSAMLRLAPNGDLGDLGDWFAKRLS
jgi:hypothetical protein